MQAAMEADIERATVVSGTPSAHVFTVLGLNAVASMIEMSGVADPAPVLGRHAVRAGAPCAHGLWRISALLCQRIIRGAQPARHG